MQWLKCSEITVSKCPNHKLKGGPSTQLKHHGKRRYQDPVRTLHLWVTGTPREGLGIMPTIWKILNNQFLNHPFYCWERVLPDPLVELALSTKICGSCDTCKIAETKLCWGSRCLVLSQTSTPTGLDAVIMTVCGQDLLDEVLRQAWLGKSL